MLLKFLQKHKKSRCSTTTTSAEYSGQPYDMKANGAIVMHRPSMSRQNFMGICLESGVSSGISFIDEGAKRDRLYHTWSQAAASHLCREDGNDSSFYYYYNNCDDDEGDEEEAMGGQEEEEEDSVSELDHQQRKALIRTYLLEYQRRRYPELRKDSLQESLPEQQEPTHSVIVHRHDSLDLLTQENRRLWDELRELQLQIDNLRIVLEEKSSSCTRHRHSYSGRASSRSHDLSSLAIDCLKNNNNK